jgi:N-acetylmuramoyl-L-alanine amidase
MALLSKRDKRTRLPHTGKSLEQALRMCLMALLLAQVMPGVASQSPPQDKGNLIQEADQLAREEIETAEQQLAELGYWTGAIDGVLDASSRHGLIAFQKAEGRNPSGRLTREEYAAIFFARRLIPRESHFAHVEVDLRKQILFCVDDAGQVTHILPISSGNGELFTSEGYTRRAVTPTGRFTVYSQIKGWRRSPLGLLYYPNYILSGIAIHGSFSVPVRPASHGCIRIPMFAAEEFSRLTPVGTTVIVYDDPAASDLP